MEIWQGVALLSPSDAVAAAEGTDRPVAGRMPGSHLSPREVIKARLAAHARGEPEPIHLYGAPRLETAPTAAIRG
jgi:hypothetical protein